ncbi:MAG: hypothetical protein ACFFDB_10710, partial [Promethearchaeota archaeon]
KLENDFPQKIKLALYITDQPPAVLITIDKNFFEMQKLEDLHDISEIEQIECDSYFAAPQGYLYGGIPVLMKGIEEGKVKMKNESIFFKILSGIIS